MTRSCILEWLPRLALQAQQRGSPFLTMLLEWLWPLTLYAQQHRVRFLMTQRSPPPLTMEVKPRGLCRLISGVSPVLTTNVQRHNAPCILM